MKVFYKGNWDAFDCEIIRDIKTKEYHLINLKLSKSIACGTKEECARFLESKKQGNLKSKKDYISRQNDIFGESLSNLLSRSECCKRIMNVERNVIRKMKSSSIDIS